MGHVQWLLILRFVFAAGIVFTRTAGAELPVHGREFVVIAAGGGKWGNPSGGAYCAFALAADGSSLSAQE